MNLKGLNVPNRTITVFEHDVLKLDYKGFSQNELDALTVWQEKRDKQYFTRIHKGIKFNSWVGIIQLPTLTIEILPKTDRTSQSSEQQVRSILLYMIECSLGISPDTNFDSKIETQNANLLHLLSRLFISLLEEIIRTGLIKKYRWNDELRSPVLKGKLLIDKQFKYNFIHIEKFACRFSAYDKNHLLHNIIKTALTHIEELYLPNDIYDKILNFKYYFENNTDIYVSDKIFSSIKWDRKNQHYFKAIQIARLLLSGLSPNFYNGKENIFSILVDMNELFESYIAAKIVEASKNTTSRVRVQREHTFWERKLIRPDIILEFNGKKVVIDTKWKLPANNYPADSDLKQMYVYNKVIGCSDAILLYPSLNQREQPSISIIKNGKYFDGTICSMWEVKLVEKKNGTIVPDKKIGKVLIDSLISADKMNSKISKF